MENEYEVIANLNKETKKVYENHWQGIDKTFIMRSNVLTEEEYKWKTNQH